MVFIFFNSPVCNIECPCFNKISNKFSKTQDIESSCHIDYIHIIFPCVFIFVIPCANRIIMSLITKLFLRYLLCTLSQNILHCSINFNQQNIQWRTQMSSCVAELTLITFKIIPHNIHDNCITAYF